MWRFAEIKTLPDIVRYWADKRPDKIALIEISGQRSYAELHSRSSQIASRLIAAGVTLQAHVGFVGRNCFEFFEIWFAAGKAGCAFVPFNWRSAVEEMRGLIADATPPIMFVSAEFLPMLREVQARAAVPFEIVAFDPEMRGKDGLATWIGDTQDTDPGVKVADTDIALLSYTSGTTGQPKGVQSAHGAFNLSFLCGSLEPAMAWHDDDIMLMSMPNFHLAGSWVSIAALYHGAALSIIPSFEAAALLTALRRDRPSIVPIVPAAMQMLLNEPGVSAGDFISVRSMMYFGSPISPALLERALATFGCEFYQFYGATEAWFIAILPHVEHVAGAASRLTSCGRPLPLVSMKVVDLDGEEVPDGTIGELMVRTPMAFSGYWQRPAATAEVLREGWYRTGDMGRRDAGGFYYLVDRTKDMIITGGENVYSVEVEQALLMHPAIAMAAVIGLPDERWGEKVTAVVVPHEGAAVTEDELRQHCRLHLAGFKVPKTIYFEASLPVTPAGKIQKPALRARLRAEEKVP
jgi:acyl-CoA synthetase (AMP-forming)/AMP-acid ligase II